MSLSAGAIVTSSKQRMISARAVIGATHSFKMRGLIASAMRTNSAVTFAKLHCSIMTGMTYLPSSRNNPNAQLVAQTMHVFCVTVNHDESIAVRSNPPCPELAGNGQIQRGSPLCAHDCTASAAPSARCNRSAVSTVM